MEDSLWLWQRTPGKRTSGIWTQNGTSLGELVSPAKPPNFNNCAEYLVERATYLVGLEISAENPSSLTRRAGLGVRLVSPTDDHCTGYVQHQSNLKLWDRPRRFATGDARAVPNEESICPTSIRQKKLNHIRSRTYSMTNGGMMTMIGGTTGAITNGLIAAIIGGVRGVERVNGTSAARAGTNRGRRLNQHPTLKTADFAIPRETGISLPGCEPGSKHYKAGKLQIIISPPYPEKNLGWHMSISHPNRYPTWDEIVFYRYRLLSEHISMVMYLPPLSEYVNLHSNCFHLHQEMPA